MTEADLPAVEAWLRLPHVARWWTRDTTAEAILTTPEAANTASRRVLEKNGFHLVAVRPVATEATDVPMAIYCLPSPGLPLSRNPHSCGAPACQSQVFGS